MSSSRNKGLTIRDISDSTILSHSYSACTHSISFIMKRKDLVQLSNNKVVKNMRSALFIICFNTIEAETIRIININVYYNTINNGYQQLYSLY